MGGRIVGREPKTFLISWKVASLSSTQTKFCALVSYCRGKANYDNWWINLPKYLTFWMNEVSSFTVVGEERAKSALTFDGSACIPDSETTCPNKATCFSPIWHFAMFNWPPSCASWLKPSSTFARCNAHAVDTKIIYVDPNGLTKIGLKNMIHEPLECCWSISETKGITL